MSTIFAVAAAGVALVAYSYGVWSARKYSLAKDPGGMPAPLLQVVTVFGAALAVNFGAFAGIDVSPTLQLGMPAVSDISLGTWFRGAGAVVYFLSLLLSAWVWSKLDWEEDPKKIVKTVVEQGRMLIGVTAAGLTLAFSLN